MRKIIILLSVLLFASCNNSESDPGPETNYVLENITFYLEGDQGLEVEHKEIHKTTHYNASPGTGTSSHIVPKGALYEYYSFTSDDFIEESYLSGSLQAFLPFNIIDDELIMAGYEEEFCFNGTYVTNDRGLSTIETSVAPFCSVTTTTEATFRYLTTSFIATFIGEVTGEIKEITGTWKRCTIGYLHSTTIVHPLQIE